MARTIKYDCRGLAHIYQRGHRMSVIYYSVKDVLVFYTLLFTLKKKYKIIVFGVVLMFNHYHLLIKAKSQEVISCFMRDLETLYSKEFNKESGHKGHVFEPVYGLSNKIRDKKQREAAAYLYNNPVEKLLTSSAIGYRWNFLAYARSDHPFSEKLTVRKASSQMRRSLQEVKYTFNRGSFLNYTVLKNCFERLSRDEIRQLVDYIIVTFRVVDYEETISLYGSFEKMLLAFDSNTGSEHDVREEYSDKSYKGYVMALQALKNNYGFPNPNKVLNLNEYERAHLCRRITVNMRVSRFIAETLLHLYQPKPGRNQPKPDHNQPAPGHNQ